MVSGVDIGTRNEQKDEDGAETSYKDEQTYAPFPNPLLLIPKDPFEHPSRISTNARIRCSL